MATNTRNITPKCRLSYPHLDVAQEPQDGKGKAKFSAAFVFAPGTDLSTLIAAALEVAKAKWGAKFKVGATEFTLEEAFAKGMLRTPFRRDAEAKGYAAGSVFINARSEQKPGCVYAHVAPGTDRPEVIPADKVKDVLYPGAFVRASLTAFAYDSNGNKGVSFALNNVQFMGDGERLDSRVAAESEFDADLSAAPADLATLI